MTNHTVSMKEYKQLKAKAWVYFVLVIILFLAFLLK